MPDIAICTYPESLCKAAPVCRRNVMHYADLGTYQCFTEPEQVFPKCKRIMPFSKSQLPSPPGEEGPDLVLA